jgi:hypothetical protein
MNRPGRTEFCRNTRSYMGVFVSIEVDIGRNDLIVVPGP